MSTTEFSELIGHVMTDVFMAEMGNELRFRRSDGREFVFYHDQGSGESVTIEDVCGDLRDLVGSPIIVAEETSNSNVRDYESCTWTFYKFMTRNGTVTVRWYGVSNGYYSESVNFREIV